MAKVSRRQFLRWLGIQLAALGLLDLLAACEGRMVELPPLAQKATQQTVPTSTRLQNTPTDTLETPTDQAGTGPTQGPEVTDTSTNTATHAPPTSTSTTQPTATHTSKPPATATHTSGPPPTATHTSPPANTATATTPPPPTNTPLPTATRTPTRSGISYLAVARRSEDPVALVQAAMQSIGGMSRFVSPGDDVIIKPNICVDYRTYEYAATTNPWVVGELVRQAVAAGAGRVRVMDYPFGGTCDSAYITSGIQAQVLAAGGEMESIAMFKFVSTSIPEGLDLTSCYIYEDILNADVVINVPIAKHHSLTRLTLGMKNLMGTIRDRPMMHQNIGQRLADLTSRIRPALTVLDGVRALVRNGPTGGNLADVHKIDHVVASHDIVAVDSYAATMYGLEPLSLSYVQTGTAMGLGRSDLQNLDIHDIPLS